MRENIIDFAALMKKFAVEYPTYEVVVCNCIDCRTTHEEGPCREVNWAVNHAEKRVYL